MHTTQKCTTSSRPNHMKPNPFPAVALFFSKWSRVMMLKLPGSSQSPQTWANAHEFQSWKTSTVDFQALPAGKVDLGSTPYFFQSCRNAHWSGIPGG